MSGQTTLLNTSANHTKSYTARYSCLPHKSCSVLCLSIAVGFVHWVAFQQKWFGADEGTPLLLSSVLIVVGLLNNWRTRRLEQMRWHFNMYDVPLKQLLHCHCVHRFRWPRHCLTITGRTLVALRCSQFHLTGKFGKPWTSFENGYSIWKCNSISPVWIGCFNFEMDFAIG